MNNLCPWMQKSENINDALNQYITEYGFEDAMQNITCLQSIVTTATESEPEMSCDIEGTNPSVEVSKYTQADIDDISKKHPNFVFDRPTITINGASHMLQLRDDECMFAPGLIFRKKAGVK